MPVGDLASAAGFPLVPDTGEEGRVRWGAREINRTRDFVAQVKALIPTLPSTAWTTYTPGTTGLTGGAATGRYRYITPKLIELWVRFTAGTVHTSGVATTMSLPLGMHADGAARQPIPALFNAEVPILARIEAGAAVVTVSSTDVMGNNWAAGQHLTNVVVKGLVAIQ